MDWLQEVHEPGENVSKKSLVYIFGAEVETTGLSEEKYQRVQ